MKNNPCNPLDRFDNWYRQASRCADIDEAGAVNLATVSQDGMPSSRFAFREIPRPPFWSGFRLVPRRMEFWVNGDSRLHNRSAFTLDGAGSWQHQLLYP